MIGSLRGRLAHRGLGDILLDVGGVGYLISVPNGILSELPPVGHEVFLHIYTHVREDALVLFGFASDAEKRVFLTLLGITGIGPKVALSVLSGLSYDEFLRAVESEEITVLTKIPGLGKKTAHRIVLELKGKLPKGEIHPADSVFEDTVSALVNLGYRKNDAADAVTLARQNGANDLESLLKEALKLLTSD